MNTIVESPAPSHAVSDSEIAACFEVMAELRPHLERAQFVSTVRQMEQAGYRLAFLEDDGQVVAVAGYRINRNLFMGKHLYVDDLVTTAPERSQGYGKVMLDWLRDIARKAACQVLHLDSGVQRHRAHAFYFAQGMTIASYHFSEPLD